MTEQLGDATDDPSDAMVALYAQWAAKPGLGLSITGNVMVDPAQREAPGNCVLDASSDAAKWRRLAEAAAGPDGATTVLLQLSMPGHQCTRAIAHSVAAASSTRLFQNADRPLAMRYVSRILTAAPRRIAEADEQSVVVAPFALAARRAHAEFGFAGVQLHAAHGYLLSRCLSAGRTELVLNVVRATREALGETGVLAIKLNSSDFARGGWTPEACIAFVKQLDSEGVDLVELSGGTYEDLAFSKDDGETFRELRRGEAFFAKVGADLRAAVPDMPLMLTGGFRTLAGMRHALESDFCSVVGCARPFAVDVDVANKLVRGAIERVQTLPEDMDLGFVGRMLPKPMAHTFNSMLETLAHNELMFGRPPPGNLVSRLALLAVSGTKTYCPRPSWLQVGVKQRPDPRNMRLRWALTLGVSGALVGGLVAVGAGGAVAFAPRL